MLPLYT